jgi:Cu+-exporting ATPase
MEVTADSAAGTYEYGGKTYYFCNPSCVEKFRAEPERYLQPSGKMHGRSAAPLVQLGVSPANPVQDKSAEYTCPMRPEVRRASMGSCPKCGMAGPPSSIAV